MKQKRVLYSDSESAIHLAKNLAYNPRTKHIDVCFYFIRELFEYDVLMLVKIQYSKNLIDMLTKPMIT